MENKRYLDKVVGSMVRSTKIDYDNERITFTFLPNTPISFPYHKLSNQTLLSISNFFDSFVKYCRDTFGLTNKEMRYVYDEWSNIIKDKIENNGE